MEKISIAKKAINKETEKLLLDVYRSGRWTRGEKTEEFEELAAKASNCKYAVALSNGTVAIEAMWRASGICWVEGADSVVYTSPLTFRATVKGLEHAGYSVAYSDIDPTTLLMGTEQGIMSSVPPRNAVVFPVDLYGRKASYSGDKLLRDGAQGIGLDFSDSWAASISFYTGKTVGTGEGGAVVTDDQELAKRIRMWRNQGMDQQGEFRDPDGFNWHMSEFQAAVGIPQMRALKDTLAKRKKNAMDYLKAFKQEQVILPLREGENTWHQFTMQSSKAPEIVSILNYLGIEARRYYPYFLQKPGYYTPNAQKAAGKVFSIPVHEHLTEDEKHFVIDKTIDVIRKVTE